MDTKGARARALSRMTDVNIAAHEYELRLRVKLLEAQLTNAKEKSDALDNEVQKLRAELARNMRETGIDETVDGLCHRISEHKEAQTANSIAIQDIQQNIVKAQAQIEALTQVPNPNASVNQLGHGRKRRNASPMAPPFKKGKNIQILDDDAVIQKLPLTSFDAIQFENGPLSRFFRCSSATIESNTSRGTKTLELLAQLVNFKDATDHDALLRIIISEVLKRLPYDKEDKIGFQVWGGDMEQPFFFPARTADQNNLDTFVNEFEKLSQSATLVNILNTDLRFKATAYKSKQYYGSAGTDNLCLFEAVSKCLTQANPTFEVPSTEKLLKLSQLPQKDAYGIDDVKILQGLLLTTFDTRLVLLDMDGNQLFRGERAKRDIFIQFDETKKHYMACLEVKKLFPKARGYCADCDVPIRTHPHRKYCVATCRRCNRYGPAFPCTQAPDYTPRRCADCNVFFLSDDCFDAHKSDRNEKGRLVIPVCNKRTTCKQCNHVIDVRSDKKHACWKVERECYLCKQQHPDGEVFCYIQPLPQKRYKRTIYCFFDCEATQNEGKHVCNVLVAEFSCDVCMKLETDPSSTEKGDTCFCTGKHKGKYVFTSFDGGNPVREFIRILTHKHRGAEAYEIIAISHNGGKYDDHIILEELQQMNIAPRIVSTGFKIFR
uniref:DNA-directed DNA polymerase n=1 Tax=Panagrellus redivivus TaxID=6233 RepID=A0A7E4VQL7_PANRE